MLSPNTVTNYTVQEKSSTISTAGRIYTQSPRLNYNSEDKEIYDSGEFNPFSDDFDSAWKLIAPLSGPDLVNTYVCKVDHSYTQDDNVPEWMRKKDTGTIESPSLSKDTGNNRFNLKDIRWAMRDEGSERLVFDIYSGDEKVSSADNYEVIDEAKDQAMDILFKNYENVGTSIPDLNQSKIIKEITASYDVETHGLNINIKFRKSPSYNTFEVENPGRLVIDFTAEGESP